jgi:hypothetical protein
MNQHDKNWRAQGNRRHHFHQTPVPTGSQFSTALPHGGRIISERRQPWPASKFEPYWLPKLRRDPDTHDWQVKIERGAVIFGYHTYADFASLEWTDLADQEGDNFLRLNTSWTGAFASGMTDGNYYPVFGAEPSGDTVSARVVMYQGDIDSIEVVAGAFVKADTDPPFPNIRYYHIANIEYDAEAETFSVGDIYFQGTITIPGPLLIMPIDDVAPDTFDLLDASDPP